MITFDPLWVYLKRRGISIYNLEYDFGLNPAEISRLKNNHNFTLHKINAYCELLHCSITDILIYIPDQVPPDHESGYSDYQDSIPEH